MIIHIPLTLQTNNMKTYAITSIIIVSRSGLDSSEYTSNYGSDRDSDGRHTQQKYHSQMRDSGGRNKPIITQESSYSSQSYSNDPNRPTSNVRNTDSSIHQRKHGTNPAEQQRTQFNQFYNTSTASVDAVDNAGMAHFHQIGQLDCCCCCGAICNIRHFCILVSAEKIRSLPRIPKIKSSASSNKGSGGVSTVSGYNFPSMPTEDQSMQSYNMHQASQQTSNGQAQSFNVHSSGIGQERNETFRYQENAL